MEMIISTVVNTAIEVMKNNGPILGIIIIILESIVPPLPLAVFITLNMYAYGAISGFVLSWVGTVIGCMLSFMAFRKWFRSFLWKKMKNKEHLTNFMNFISNIKFVQLVILMALPFTPSFLINIGAGLSKIPIKRFFLAVLISKISVIYFWGYIGTGIIESIKDPYIIFQIILMLIVAYVVSKGIEKKFNID